MNPYLRNVDGVDISYLDKDGAPGPCPFRLFRDHRDCALCDTYAIYQAIDTNTDAGIEDPIRKALTAVGDYLGRAPHLLAEDEYERQLAELREDRDTAIFLAGEGDRVGADRLVGGSGSPRPAPEPASGSAGGDGQSELEGFLTSSEQPLLSNRQVALLAMALRGETLQFADTCLRWLEDDEYHQQNLSGL